MENGNSNLFDVTMGSYDGAEICELVNLFILDHLGKKFSKKRQDDCLTVYRKSLIEWLTSVGYKEHAFTVDLQSGHKSLWKACEKVFDQIVLLN